MLRRLPLTLILLALTWPAFAQHDDRALSEGEIEQLRDSAYVANDRILVFIKLLDTRNKAIQDLFAHPRKPGREQDTHDLLEQFTSIADELNDNLDDYGPHHRDIRKALPKLLEATERWASNIKQPPKIPPTIFRANWHSNPSATSVKKQRSSSKTRRRGSQRILPLKTTQTSQQALRAEQVRIPAR